VNPREDQPFLSERIGRRHDLGQFSCGQPALDRWLVQAARNADQAGTARTFVWCDDQAIVVAYFSLAPHEVRREILPIRIAHGAPDAVPAILLARLALHSSLQGQSLGESLLIDALERATAAVSAAGGRLVVVDAIDTNAASFYERYGFVRCPEVPLRLVRKASDIARSLGEPG
jgi:predicted N-acetyltransferase YhbS